MCRRLQVVCPVQQTSAMLFWSPRLTAESGQANNGHKITMRAAATALTGNVSCAEQQWRSAPRAWASSSCGPASQRRLLRGRLQRGPTLKPPAVLSWRKPSCRYIHLCWVFVHFKLSALGMGQGVLLTDAGRELQHTKLDQHDML